MQNAILKNIEMLSTLLDKNITVGLEQNDWTQNAGKNEHVMFIHSCHSFFYLVHIHYHLPKSRV